MIFFRNLFFNLIVVLLLVMSNQLLADDNQSKEEPLPLNDPFVGDSSLTGGSSNILATDPKEAQNEMSLYKFKLVGVMTSEKEDGFVSLINSSGNIVTLGMFEELSPGVKLVALNNKEAVFEKNGESLMIINFKNQVVERSK